MLKINRYLNFKSKLKSKVLLFFFLNIFHAVLAQTPEAQLAKVNANSYPEKIYIHYDKPAYFAGETIWFKAYLMEGLYPAASSTVLAVELLNDSGRIIDKRILPIRTGATAGDFVLPANLLQGSYTIRAYTRRHMSYDSKKMYVHAFSIYNPTNVRALANTASDSYMVTFFPEGGNFIGSIKNTIAFKCTDKWGYPKEIEGKILDAKGTSITSFKSTHDGMGKFIFTPRLGEKYLAECIINSAVNKVVPLPEVMSQGAGLTIISTGSETYFNVDAGTITIPGLMPAYVMGVEENLVAFKLPLDVTAKESKQKIPVEKLPTGILQVTVFNANHQPLAERLIFVNSGDYVPPSSFRTDTLDLDKRKKNAFSFSIDDTTAGTFSVAVTAYNGDANTTDNIISRLLLTDDIKGDVYAPAYYFEKNDEQHARDLDLVMLTNGWRRYNWNEILAYNNNPPVFKDPGFLSLSATALDPVTKAPYKNKALSIYAKTKDNFDDFFGVNTDSSGSFKLNEMIFEDTLKLSFTSTNNKKEKLYLAIKNQPIHNLFFVNETGIPILKYRPVDENTFYYKNNFNRPRQNYTPAGLLMKEIEIVTKAKSEKEKYEKKFVSGRLGSFANAEIDFLKEPVNDGQNILEYLKSRLAGVNISGGPSEYNVNYRGNRSMTGGPTPMALFLDEFQVESSQLSTIQTSNVAMVKVFSNALTSSGGALAVYTKRGGDSQSFLSVEKTEILLEGFSPTREFFSPDYDDGKSGNIAADERSTLYWNPYLTTSAQNNRVRFSFYNSDNTKQFRVIIEGVLVDGRLLYIEKILK
jgi:hypothetical protein